MATAQQRKDSIAKAKESNQKQFKKFKEAGKSQADKRRESGKDLSQKQKALRYGGRYSEGGVIYTVNIGEGSEQTQTKSNYPDSTEAYQKYRMTQQGQAVPIAAKQQYQKSESESYFADEYGEVSTGALPLQEKKVNIVKLAKESNPLNKQLGWIQKPVESGLKDIGLQIGSIGVAVGEAVKTGSFDKGSKAATKFYETHKDPEYKNPFSKENIVRKGAEVFGFASVSGGSSAGLSGVGKLGQTISKTREVSKIEKLLREPGIVSGKEKISPTEYLISKGTEKKPARVPFVTVKYGEKGGTTFTEITPGSKTLSPSEINIRGKLNPGFQNVLEAKQIDKFIFKSTSPSSSGRSAYAKGVIGSGIKPIAEGRTALVKDLLKKNPDALRQSLKKPRSVFAETKAERITFPINPNVQSLIKNTKPFKPFSYGIEKPMKGIAGSSGKAKSLTQQESKSVKEMIVSKSTKSEKSISQGVGLATPSINLYGLEQQAVQYPPGTKEKLVGVFTTQTPKQSERTLTPQILIPKQETTQKLIPSFKIDQPIKQITTTTQKPPTVTITPKQPQRTITGYRIGDPTRQTTTQIQPPVIPPIVPEKPVIIKPPIPFGGPFGLRGSSGGGGYRKPSGRKLGFIGSMPATQVEGMFKRPMTIYSSESSYGAALYKSINYRPKKQSRKKPRFSNGGINITGKKRNKMPKKISFGGKYNPGGIKISITGKSRKIRF